MLAFLLRRTLAVVPVMAMVAVIVFAILRLTPGDPAAIIAGDSATPEQLEQIRQTMGLDQPIPTQFVMWVGQLLRGDLGVSLLSGTQVSDMILQRMGPSLALCLSTITLSVLLAVPLGVLAAWRQGRLLDRAVMAFSVMGFSVPVFVTAYVLILIFSIKLGWFPVQGYKPLSDGFLPFVQSLVLPTIALSTVYVALIARITRTSIIEVMGEDFIRTARAKGLRERAVLLGHALGNAAVPIVTIIGVGIALLISGVVVTESVFNLPGLGRLVVEAVLGRDYPVIQALILLFAFLYVLINLVVDALYTVFDPRIRY
ncbi:Dipeptide transport system permease protein DppB (TC 3.A.1.5.2) [plant metagenome]|uniref:Dipeptide transport system permease protein DppB (TC 3.A.1.5.2) n=2 Tax=root TaxID=1 RepID=A0A1C3JYZ6_9BURK|nr:ABC transporter permease [Orrella dioscoreae]SBT24479.1 Dipeptide transport system permease protein DppB (TC 3.A.1.5.2) [Orrella dioscoreae]SOE52293.1 Dipeptide transport system permease protein DppB (TC 3.A.1.5.2) [Orrella dioscoreae]